VHRDLKPANVKMTAEGAVKLLDLGLATALEPEAAFADIANSPTLTYMATQAGFILGTAAYMSPEQAKGKTVDRRSDIWSFGCLFYEMLTGGRAFCGETVTDILASVIKSRQIGLCFPPTPATIRKLLGLTKKNATATPESNARFAIEEVISGADLDAVVAMPSPRERSGHACYLGCCIRHVHSAHRCSFPRIIVAQLSPQCTFDGYQPIRVQSYPALSPDGRWSHRFEWDGHYNIYVRLINGGNLVQLTVTQVSKFVNAGLLTGQKLLCASE
jgi:serine/threonine protein kinase